MIDVSIGETLQYKYQPSIRAHRKQNEAAVGTTHSKFLLAPKKIKTRISQGESRMKEMSAFLIETAKREDLASLDNEDEEDELAGAMGRLVEEESTRSPRALVGSFSLGVEEVDEEDVAREGAEPDEPEEKEN